MSITIPKNVRQMGEPEEQRKIYVEDYVVTYLRQYAKEEILESRGAILLGNAQEEGGIPYLFIRSALELAECVEVGGAIAFTEELWMRVYAEIEQYFPGQEILGWFLSVPGFPLEISYEILSSHRNCFSGWDKVLFMEDPTEGEEAFFAMEQGALVRQQGYFVFYERNEPMQQYMLEKRGGKSVDAGAEFTDRAARSFRTLVQEKKEQSNQKRVMTFLYGVSTFLIMVVLVIGITMINNYEKMEQVELALTNLTQNLEAQQDVEKTELAGGQSVEAYNGQGLPASSITEEQEENNGNRQEESEQNDSAEEAEQAAENQTENFGENRQQEASAPAGERPEFYIVQKGDTLLGISRKIYGNDRHIKEICQLNAIEDSNMIYEGEKILLP